jgi:hypothetical protein
MTVAPGTISKQMVKWAAGLAIESIVLVQGLVKKSPEIIKSASIGDVEIHISQVGDRSITVYNSLMFASLRCISYLDSKIGYRSPLTMQIDQTLKSKHRNSN